MDFNKLHKRNLLTYQAGIDNAFLTFIKEVAVIAVKYKQTETLFNFSSNKKLYDKFNKSLSAYENALKVTVTSGIKKEWEFANKKNDALRDDTLKGLKGKLSKEQFEAVSSVRSPRNMDALEAFQKRKKGKYKVSDRVWKITENARTEMQFAVDLSLSNGMSAQELNKRLRKQLKDPSAMFRRVRDKHGNLVASKAMKNYHSGRGVYKSAHANARRFIVNEINVAYKEADVLRMKQNPDIVGYEVYLSPSHKVYDMCDDLKGKYPKSFLFNGWHVQCMCGVRAILKTEAEMLREIKAGVVGSPKKSENYVGDVPDNFKEWVEDNREKMRNWKTKPSFIEDNYRYGKIVHGLKPMQ